MKLLVVLPLTLPGISGLLIGFGHSLLEYLSPSVQVVFVMALFPLVMNIVQFCLVDQVIKGGKDEDFGKGGDEEDFIDEYERLPGGDQDADRRSSSAVKSSSALTNRISLSDRPTSPSVKTRLSQSRRDSFASDALFDADAVEYNFEADVYNPASATTQARGSSSPDGLRTARVAEPIPGVDPDQGSSSRSTGV